jgi:hypothetical protein
MPTMPYSATIVDTLTIVPLPFFAIPGASSATRKFGTLTFSSTVLAKNIIGLANVELARVRLLPFPDRARPYINNGQFPSHRASRALCKPKSLHCAIN